MRARSVVEGGGAWPEIRGSTMAVRQEMCPFFGPVEDAWVGVVTVRVQHSEDPEPRWYPTVTGLS